MKIKNIIISIILVAGLNTFADEKTKSVWVDVVSSKPVYKKVTIREPYEEVVSRPYEVTVPCVRKERYDRHERNNNEIGLDTVIGAGIGIAIGNQIGKGRGRDVAKVAGGVLGAVIANNTRDSRHHSDNVRYCKRKEYRDEVVTRYEYKTKRKLIGYENHFYYNGTRYTKMTTTPKDRIRVRTTISF
jgi:uncharacterized protein YcfJ